MNCCNCHDQVGTEVKVAPFIERKPSGEIEEVWCPQCFCFHRTFLEAKRYQPGAYVPILCLSPKCGMTTIDHGPSGRCGQCGGRSVRVVGPKPQAGTALQEATLLPPGS